MPNCKATQWMFLVSLSITSLFCAVCPFFNLVPENSCESTSIDQYTHYSYMGTSRGSDPYGFDPDPDPTFDKNRI